MAEISQWNTNLFESVFLGFATDLPELDPSRDLERLSPFTGLDLITGEKSKNQYTVQSALSIGDIWIQVQNIVCKGQYKSTGNMCADFV